MMSGRRRGHDDDGHGGVAEELGQRPVDVDVRVVTFGALDGRRRVGGDGIQLEPRARAYEGDVEDLGREPVADDAHVVTARHDAGAGMGVGQGQTASAGTCRTDWLRAGRGGSSLADRYEDRERPGVWPVGRRCGWRFASRQDVRLCGVSQNGAGRPTRGLS